MSIMSFWERLNDYNKPVENRESKIGSLGEIAFEVSNYDRILTLDNYSKSITANYAEHEVIGSKPLLEFTGPKLQTISFDVLISAYLGYNPRKQMKQLIEYCEKGAVLSFILGDEPIGDNKWVIESLTEKAEQFTGNGEILSSTASISLKEYIEDEVKDDGNSGGNNGYAG